MIDKIQSNPSPYNTDGVNRIAGKQEAVSRKFKNVDDTSVQVSLSDNALALQRITQAVKDSPDVRIEVVNAIQAKLEAGTYQVNAEALAEKLLPILK